MDTILFFYQKRGIQEPEAEPLGRKRYLLIRVAVNVGQEEWFGTQLRNKETQTASGESRGGIGEIPAVSRRRFLRCFAFCRERRCRQAREQERARQEAEQQNRINQVEADLRQLSALAEEWAGGWEDCYCVYEDRVRRVLVGNGGDAMQNAGEERQMKKDAVLPVLWQKYFPLREFGNYTQRLWVEELLVEAALPHFVILGSASCLPEVIEQFADRMKSLRWILPENDYSEELLAFVEDFYTEYGLAIMFQTVPAGQRIRLACQEPSVILDFVDESRLGFPKVAEGSVWLDMLSQEEKYRRIEGRVSGVRYVSLKEKWKTMRKKAPFIPEPQEGVRSDLLYGTDVTKFYI